MDINILNFPPEVIKGILPNLEWNDLLRFRRVCKTTMFIVNDYIRLNPKLAPEIQIDEKGDKTLKEFMNLNIPTTKLFINNVSGRKFYKKNEKYIKTFLQNSGKHVKNLRVNQISPIIYGKEWDFFDGLGHIEKFEAGRHGFGQKFNSQRSLDKYGEKKLSNAHKDFRYRNNIERPIPLGFSKLKYLKIGPEEDKYILPYTTYNSICMTLTPKKLEFFALPLSSDNKLSGDPERISPLPSHHVYENSTTGFVLIHFYLYLQNGEFAGETILKTVDFLSYHNEFREPIPEMEINTSRWFLLVCKECERKDVKLMNVAGNWFQELDRFRQDIWDSLGVPILSLVNLHPRVIQMDMPNLEKIEIRETSKYFEGINNILPRPSWPSLKSVDIAVEPEMNTGDVPINHRTHGSVSTTAANYVFRLLFENVQRNNLVELRLDFSKVAEKVMLLNSESIVRSCPNLRTLTIVKYPGTNRTLLTLFDGLPDLEDLSLEYCKNLGNMGFIGLDIQNPVFLKLTKLKKLTLKGLDQMPQITDLLFSMVIRHQNLSELTLTSDSPVKLVTVSGIRALLNGNFAESIERFSLMNLSLDNVSDGELRMLEKEFRSYDML